MSTTDQTVVIDQPDTEVVLTAFGFYARCKRCPWCSEFTPSKSKARMTGLAGHGCLKAKSTDDGLRECAVCSDRVAYLSSRDLCDGCEDIRYMSGGDGSIADSQDRAR